MNYVGRSLIRLDLSGRCPGIAIFPNWVGKGVGSPLRTARGVAKFVSPYGQVSRATGDTAGPNSYQRRNGNFPHDYRRSLLLGAQADTE